MADETMAEGANQAGEPRSAQTGLVVVRRLHRMVRHGYRPWLGYDVASGADCDIHLRCRGNTASLQPDGTVTFTTAIAPSPDPAAGRGDGVLVIDGQDEARFDAAFPPNRPNKRNLVRRLYEVGFGAW